MVASIPASAIVSVTPGVISAGGTGLDMVGLMLVTSTRVPVGSILKFSSAADVSAYFGPSSNEYARAQTYFNGFTNSFIKPAFLLFSRYVNAAAPAFLRGASAGLTLAQVQALTGTLALSVNGATVTSSSINLSGATSMSNAATIIQAAFTTPTFTVSYDTVSNSFAFTSNTAGAGQTMGYATAGTVATGLSLTQAAGAVISQGSAVVTPGATMDAIAANTQDFATFTTLFPAIDADIVSFATWNGAQGNRYLYVGWTSDAAALANGDTSSPGPLIKAAGLSGTALLWAPSSDKAAFLLGYAASIDFTRLNGRTVAAFRSGSGLTADVTNQTIGANLLANGYSFYGSYATANAQFTWLYSGQLSGPFSWIDSYLDQIWMNNAFQLSLMTALGILGQIPYNADGYAMLEAVLQTDINNAVTFGAIRDGVTLSSTQVAELTALAGKDISDIMFSRGWYLSIQDPGASVRAARGSPVMTFFYTDGSSIQRLSLSSLMVQ